MVDSLSECLREPGLGQVEARNPEFSSALWHRLQLFKAVPLPQRAHWQEAGAGVGLRLKPQHCSVEFSVPRGSVVASPLTPGASLLQLTLSAQVVFLQHQVTAQLDWDPCFRFHACTHTGGGGCLPSSSGSGWHGQFAS